MLLKKCCKTTPFTHQGKADYRLSTTPDRENFRIMREICCFIANRALYYALGH